MEIRKKYFGEIPGEGQVHLYTLGNDRGMEVEIINYGATITAVRVPDRQQVTGDVVLGFENLEGYLADQPYLGAICGRVCNRIGNAGFEIDGIHYSLTANEGNNQLHGGHRGFDKRIWKAETSEGGDEILITLGYRSVDGEEGYPGNAEVKVDYFLNNQNELGIRIRATTDSPTHINLTNHSYFNLNNGRGNILDHELIIDSEHITELNRESIPTGRILPVAGTPYDFRKAHAIGQSIDQVEPGYDINYVLADTARELAWAASLHDPVSGRTMEVLTTLPGIQLYTSNYLEGITGKKGLLYGKHSAVCLETQYFPDGANQPSFPSTLLRPGAAHSSMTVYRFSTDHE